LDAGVSSAEAESLLTAIASEDEEAAETTEMIEYI
tara:strand:+ start:7988 stop:8092 length:105 start_codon:yes stop_codon:yes gene_type:complete